MQKSRNKKKSMFHKTLMSAVQNINNESDDTKATNATTSEQNNANIIRQQILQKQQPNIIFDEKTDYYDLWNEYLEKQLKQKYYGEQWNEKQNTLSESINEIMISKEIIIANYNALLQCAGFTTEERNRFFYELLNPLKKQVQTSKYNYLVYQAAQNFKKNNTELFNEICSNADLKTKIAKMIQSRNFYIKINQDIEKIQQKINNLTKSSNNAKTQLTMKLDDLLQKKYNLNLSQYFLNINKLKKALNKLDTNNKKLDNIIDDKSRKILNSNSFWIYGSNIPKQNTNIKDRKWNEEHFLPNKANEAQERYENRLKRTKFEKIKRKADLDCHNKKWHPSMFKKGTISSDLMKQYGDFSTSNQQQYSTKSREGKIWFSSYTKNPYYIPKWSLSDNKTYYKKR